MSQHGGPRQVKSACTKSELVRFYGRPNLRTFVSLQLEAMVKLEQPRASGVYRVPSSQRKLTGEQIKGDS